MTRYDDPDVTDFIYAASRQCRYPTNYGEVVSVLHGLGYSLPGPCPNETDRLIAAVERWQRARGRSISIPPRWSGVLEVAESLGYRKGTNTVR